MSSQDDPLPVLRLCLEKIAYLIATLTKVEMERISPLRKAASWARWPLQSKKALQYRIEPDDMIKFIASSFEHLADKTRANFSSILPNLLLDQNKKLDRRYFLAEHLQIAVMAFQEVETNTITFATNRDFATSLIYLAEFAFAACEMDLALDLINTAAFFNDGGEPICVDISKLGHELLIQFDAAAAIAGASILAARNAVTLASESPVDQLRAHDACEVAVERIMQLDAVTGRFFYALMLPIFRRHRLSAALALRAEYVFTDQPDQLNFNSTSMDFKFSARSRRLLKKRTQEDIEKMAGLMEAEQEFENFRLRLDHFDGGTEVVTNEIDWKFSLPSFRHVVPHRNKFLEEKDFPEKLLVLTHELSHVLAFLGGLGMALAALRVAALNVTMEFGYALNEGDERSHNDFATLEQIIAELPPGDAVKLLPAERLIEIRRKSRALVDVWTPWLEGIAVYGELTADTSSDPESINPVSECLRNIIDLVIETADPNTIREEAEAYTKNFDEHCSKAIKDKGPARMLSYCRKEQKPYFHGYLAARALAAAWRQRTGQNLAGIECFSLLLHATRYGIDEFIPDLSLHSDEFASSARDGMSDFVSRLAALPADQIDLFLGRPEQLALGTKIKWKGGRLQIASQADINNAEDLQLRMNDTRIAQAYRSLTRVEDLDRFEARNEVERVFYEGVTRQMAQLAAFRIAEPDWVELCRNIFNTITIQNSILPLGYCSSGFYIERSPEDDSYILWLNIRGGLEQVDTPQPSYSVFGFPVSDLRGEALEAELIKSGVPRMNVARVIILSDVRNKAAQLHRFPHLFALFYNDWSEIYGAGTPSEKLGEILGEGWDFIREIIRRRMQGDEFKELEGRFIASSDEIILRTIRWLGSSEQWSLAGVECDLSGWATHISKIATETLQSRGSREAVQREAQVTLMEAVYGKNDWARSLAETTFPRLVRANERRSISAALFSTALRAGDCDVLDQYGSKISIEGRSIFTKGPAGWDVRPAACE